MSSSFPRFGGGFGPGLGGSANTGTGFPSLADQQAFAQAQAAFNASGAASAAPGGASTGQGYNNSASLGGGASSADPQLMASAIAAYMASLSGSTGGAPASPQLRAQGQQGQQGQQDASQVQQQMAAVQQFLQQQQHQQQQQQQQLNQSATAAAFYGGDTTSNQSNANSGAFNAMLGGLTGLGNGNGGSPAGFGPSAAGNYGGYNTNAASSATSANNNLSAFPSSAAANVNTNNMFGQLGTSNSTPTSASSASLAAATTKQHQAGEAQTQLALQQLQLQYSQQQVAMQMQQQYMSAMAASLAAIQQQQQAVAATAAAAAAAVPAPAPATDKQDAKKQERVIVLLPSNVNMDLLNLKQVADAASTAADRELGIQDMLITVALTPLLNYPVTATPPAAVAFTEVNGNATAVKQAAPVIVAPAVKETKKYHPPAVSHKVVTVVTPPPPAAASSGSESDSEPTAASESSASSSSEDEAEPAAESPKWASDNEADFERKSSDFRPKHDAVAKSTGNRRGNNAGGFFRENNNTGQQQQQQQQQAKTLARQQQPPARGQQQQQQAAKAAHPFSSAFKRGLDLTNSDVAAALGNAPSTASTAAAAPAPASSPASSSAGSSRPTWMAPNAKWQPFYPVGSPEHTKQKLEREQKEKEAKEARAAAVAAAAAKPAQQPQARSATFAELNQQRAAAAAPSAYLIKSLPPPEAFIQPAIAGLDEPVAAAAASLASAATSARESRMPSPKAAAAAAVGKPGAPIVGHKRPVGLGPAPYRVTLENLHVKVPDEALLHLAREMKSLVHIHYPPHNAKSDFPGRAAVFFLLDGDEATKFHSFLQWRIEHCKMDKFEIRGLTTTLAGGRGGGRGGATAAAKTGPKLLARINRPGPKQIAEWEKEQGQTKDFSLEEFVGRGKGKPGAQQRRPKAVPASTDSELDVSDDDEDEYEAEGEQRQAVVPKQASDDEDKVEDASSDVKGKGRNSNTIKPTASPAKVSSSAPAPVTLSPAPATAAAADYVRRPDPMTAGRRALPKPETARYLPDDLGQYSSDDGGIGSTELPAHVKVTKHVYVGEESSSESESGSGSESESDEADEEEESEAIKTQADEDESGPESDDAEQVAPLDVDAAAHGQDGQAADDEMDPVEAAMEREELVADLLGGAQSDDDGELSDSEPAAQFGSQEEEDDDEYSDETDSDADAPGGNGDIVDEGAFSPMDGDSDFDSHQDHAAHEAPEHVDKPSSGGSTMMFAMNPASAVQLMMQKELPSSRSTSMLGEVVDQSEEDDEHKRAGSPSAAGARPQSFMLAADILAASAEPEPAEHDDLARSQ